LYVLLSLAGHSDAHEEARVLARKARAAKAPLAQLIRTDPAVKDFCAGMSPEQRAVLDDPARYLGAAAQTTRAICDKWETELALAKIAGTAEAKGNISQP
jgi:hypothetical protein